MVSHCNLTLHFSSYDLGICFKPRHVICIYFSVNCLFISFMNYLVSRYKLDINLFISFMNYLVSRYKLDINYIVYILYELPHIGKKLLFSLYMI